MMQMKPTIPGGTQNYTNIYEIKPVNFRGSPLNPKSCSTQSISGPSSTDKTRVHLHNLEKLLQKPAQSDPIPAARKRGRGILEGLDVTRFWPDMMTTITSAASTSDHDHDDHERKESLSPFHLNRLQQLLSKTPEYSPRNYIGSRWQEYHGSNDWAGLLDPLDENLRREVVRYGEFVQAAYRSFHSNPATSSTESGLDSWNDEVALPDSSYKVTKSLYATSSIGLPKWVDEVAPDLGWMTQRSSWIGYVAVCDNQREIARMGRRDIVIALRGTSTCLEWVENVRDVLVPMCQSPSTDNGTSNSNNKQECKVECGFLNLFKTKGELHSNDGLDHQIPSLAESVVQEIRRLMETYKGETLSITVTGHSLGAALALLVADELISSCSTTTTPPPPVAVFSFGSPRVGNRAFANRLKSKNVKVLRVVNNQDVITRIPGIFISEELDQKFKNTRMDGVLELLDKNLPWAYTHVGTELKVDTKMSPYLKPNADVACCHDLEAYLHLVDGYLASNCPFRSNAKRSLLKLLTEQGSNVKKLYTSKAKSLTSLKVDRVQEEDQPHVNRQISTCLPSPSR